MNSFQPKQTSTTWRLVFVPALISLAVTLLRLTGELRHWSPRWFTSETMGFLPSGVTWVVGITWLALPFGVYFAWKRVHENAGPASAGGAVAWAFVGLALMLIFRFVPWPKIGFPKVLLLIWLFMLIPAVIQYFGWPQLFKTLLAYGFAARIPVVVVMFLAMRGHWGTHYDYVGMPSQFQMTFWLGFFWLAFFPQLIFWISFTILAGSLAGSITALIVKKPQPASSAQPS